MLSFQYLVIPFNHIMIVFVFFIDLFGKLVAFNLEEGSEFISLFNWFFPFNFIGIFFGFLVKS